jgi:hypothetical protein
MPAAAISVQEPGPKTPKSSLLLPDVLELKEIQEVNIRLRRML